MICEFRDVVAAHLLGGLPGREAVQIDRHVLGCDSCAQYRRQMSIVRTLLDNLDRPPLDADGHLVGALTDSEPPADLVEAGVAQMIGRRQRRPLRDWRVFLAGVAAATILGVVPVSTYAWIHRPARATLRFVGTAAAPQAWGEVKLHPRTDGTIVDFEAGDLPDPGGRFAITVTAGGSVLARQEFRADTDGWGQVLLATDRPLSARYTIDVQRLDGPSSVTVLRCRCSI